MNLKKTRTLFLLALVSALILILLQPFSAITHNGDIVRIIAIGGYAVIGALAVLLNEVLISAMNHQLKKSLFTKFLLGTIVVPFFIFCYKNILSGFEDFTFSGYWLVATRAFAIGIFVIPFVYLYELVSSSRKKIILKSENKMETLVLDFNELILIESSYNYVTVYFQNNGSVKKKLIRNSLKKLEKELRQPEIFRVHRSYMVNMLSVIMINKNGTNMSLQLSGLDVCIPVSRKHKKTIQNYFLQTTHKKQTTVLP